MIGNRYLEWCLDRCSKPELLLVLYMRWLGVSPVLHVHIPVPVGKRVTAIACHKQCSNKNILQNIHCHFTTTIVATTVEVLELQWGKYGLSILVLCFEILFNGESHEKEKPRT